MTLLDLGNHLEGHRIGGAIRSLEIKLQELTEDLLPQKKENQRLEEINEQLRAQLENRDKEMQELKAENEMLKGKIKELEARLAKRCPTLNLRNCLQTSKDSLPDG